MTQLVQKVVLPVQVLQFRVQARQVRSMGTVPVVQEAATTQVLFRTVEKK